MRDRKIKIKTSCGLQAAVEIRGMTDPLEYTLIGMCDRIRHLREAMERPSNQGIHLCGFLEIVMERDKEGPGYFIYIRH